MELLSSDEYKSELIKMLAWFDDFCKKNRILYSVIGGTLIGTIRHQGFIPWDDDVDVAITRVDYNKILHLKHQVNSSGLYDIISVEDGSSPFPFIKLINKSIRIQENFLKKDEVSYLWIDIFPLDILPENKIIRYILFKRTRIYRKLLILSRVDRELIRINSFKNFLIYYLSLLCRRVDQLYFGMKISTLAQSYKNCNSNLIGGVVWGYGPQESFNNQGFEKFEIKKFENINIMTMFCWNEYLTNVYGNYMELPPIDKRVSHKIKAWRVL